MIRIHMMNKKGTPTIGPILRAWREKYDLSVRDAAPTLGVSIATLSRIERGGQMDAATQLKLIVYLFESEAK
jgi:transcriptional regulator with XRE-family HTH domain